MPFTFSHPAIVLPFCCSKKIPVSVTGLVAGSMIPDFEFLFLLRESDYWGHLWPGVLLLNIPLAIISSFIFHLLIRNCLILHLPKFFRLRLQCFIEFNWTAYFKKKFAAFLICTILGIASHLFLDAFTHRDGAIAQQANFFYYTVSTLRLPIYFLLQIVFSLLGAAYILWFVLKLKKQKSLQQISCRPLSYWLVFFIAAVAVLAVRFTIDKRHNSHEDIIIAATGSLLYALLFTSIFFYRPTKQLMRQHFT